MDPDNGIDFHWHDYSCKFNNYFICEQEIETRYVDHILNYMNKMVPPLCQCVYPFIFIRPSLDGTYYGMVMSVRPSGSPSVRPSQFSALFSYMLWHIDLKFCVSLYFYARKIKFECHQFPSLFAGVMLLFNFKLLQICSFPHFSPTCFDILSLNFVYDFVLMYHRASLSFVILLQFLLELCLFVNLEYSKYTISRTFLLQALTYWAEILHMTLFYCTTDQVRVSSIFVGVMPPFELRILEIHSFPYFSLTPFSISSWKFAYYFVFLYFRSSLSVVNLRLFLCLFPNLEYCKYSFPHFSLTRFDILSWNFAHDFVLLYYRSTSSVVNLRQCLWELCPLSNVEYWKYTVFRTLLLHPLAYRAESLHITLFFCTTDQVWVSSICVYFYAFSELRIL